MCWAGTASARGVKQHKGAQVCLFTSCFKSNQEPVGVEIRPLYLTEGTEAPSHPTQLQQGGEANPWTQPTVSE